MQQIKASCECTTVPVVTFPRLTALTINYFDDAKKFMINTGTTVLTVLCKDFLFGLFNFFLLFFLLYVVFILT